MPVDSLKNLLGMFPYFLTKSPESNFYKSQSVSNKQFQDLYNSLHDVYRSFHLNKRCLVWREQSEAYNYTVHFIANYPNLKSVTCYKNDDVIYAESYTYDDGTDTFEYIYESNTETDEDYSDDDTPNIIPSAQFKIQVETYDEYTIEKGYPENNTIQGNAFDHDESLDEIGALHNIPRKQYTLVDEELYSLTEPPYNNQLSEDDYHYMNRIITYLVLFHTLPLPVAEIWKLYGILPDMENREHYLLKMFDIFRHDYHYDNNVDEQGKYTCSGDRLFVDDWNPREWEHKDIFYDYSTEYGTYFFVNINTKTPSENQPIKLSFRFLNNLAVEMTGDYLIDISLNDEVIVEDYTQLIYPPSETQRDEEGEIIVYPEISNLLDNSIQDNILKITGKKSTGEIISTEQIILRIQGCGTADYYVRINGDDNNDGNSEAPFQTITKALNSVHGNKNIISIGPGEYTLPSTLTVKNNCTLLGCATGEEEVIIKSEQNSFFRIPSNRELILKRLKLQSTDCEDLSIDSAVYSNNNTSLPLTVTLLPEPQEDNILFNPEFTQENPALVTSNGNGYYSVQSDGVWTFTNAILTEGWSNTGNWEADYDLKCTGLRYIGFKTLCLLDGTTIFGGWENCIATTPSGTVTRDNDDCLGLLHGSIWDNPSTDWVHIHIEKTSSTNISITKTGDTANNGTVNYTWEELSNYPFFTIGAGNNGGSNFGNNKVMIKNLIVKKI